MRWSVGVWISVMVMGPMIDVVAVTALPSLSPPESGCERGDSGRFDDWLP